MSDTVFGKIIRGELPADKVYEDDEVIAFRDVNPIAPTHILIIPKRHIANARGAVEADKELLGELILRAAKIAEGEGIADKGYRLVFNVGDHGGESVFHLHLHLIGGRRLSWPPG